MIRSFFYICCISILSACAVGPDYVKPQAVPEIPAGFKNISGWKVAAPGNGLLKEKWWESYNDRQLNALMELLNLSNQNIQQAEANYRQARALIQSAKAGYYPNLGVGAAAVRSQKSINANTASKTTSTAPAWDFQIPIDLAWEIDLWGKIRRTVEASVATAAASADDLASARLSMQTTLASSYFQLKAVDAQKALFDQTVGDYRKYLELTRNRYKSGVAARSDLLQAETQLKSTEAQAIDLDIQRAQFEHAIAVLVGTVASQFSLPRDPTLEAPPRIPLVIPSEMLEQRPDIAAAERRVAAANAQIGVAKAAWFPTVKLSATAGLESSSLSNWIAWPSRFWSFGPAVSQTIFDGGVRKSQSEQALAIYDATVATYRQTVLTAFQDVEDNLATLRILEAEAEVQDEAVKAAQTTTAVITNQYRAGIVGYMNVINAQTTELSNRRTAVAIAGRRLVASVLLIKALGGGWQKDAAR